MKIKLAILDGDKGYLNRMLTAFGNRYADRLEIYSFQKLEIAMENLDKTKIDVLVANEAFVIDTEKIPRGCGFAYLVDSPDIESVREERAICKYQKAELIYKQILSLYSEKTEKVSGLQFGENACKVIAFVSPGGGVGSSTAAAAAAIHLALNQKKVLYLNMEHFGNPDVFFSAEGQGDFSDIIYTLKSKKGNLPLKLESLVKQDSSGVCFYSGTKLALDMTEMKQDEMKQLIEDIKNYGEYQYLVLDMDFSLGRSVINTMKLCHEIVIVTDGSDIANVKLDRAVQAFEVMDLKEDNKILPRCVLLYNRFSSRTSHKVSIQSIKELGGIPRFEGFSIRKLLAQLAGLEVFNALI